MRMCRKWAAILLFAMIAVLSMATMTSFAASRKKISTVTVKVTSDIQPGTRYGEETIEIETRGGKKYRYDYYEIESIGFDWDEEDVPEITIYLTAEEGYYFSLTKASAVKLSGATYVKASKQDSSQTLKLTVKLPSLKETVAEQTEVALTQGAYAYWDEVRGAGTYELRLYRNGEGVGASILTTEKPYYDFTSMMSRPGHYYVKVRSVNGINTDNKNEWVESEGIEITSEMAAAIRNGTAPKRPLLGEWRYTNEKWWYEHEDGTYTRENWEEIDGEWYFFDEEGYMRTGWIEWKGERYYCDDKTGEMLRGTVTPDGYILDRDGTLKSDN